MHDAIYGVDGELWQIMEYQKQTTIGMQFDGIKDMLHNIQTKSVPSVLNVLKSNCFLQQKQQLLQIRTIGRCRVAKAIVRRLAMQHSASTIAVQG
jgi:hypothetical protein